MTNFITPVSMQVTQKQYETDLRAPLLKMGYKEEDLDKCGISLYIIATNYWSNSRFVTNVTESGKNANNRHFIDHYNPELFLALAAMTDAEYGIPGEYWYCKEDLGNAFTKCFIYESVRSLKEECALLTNDEAEDGQQGKNLEYFRKATKEELIKKFDIKKEMSEKVVEQKYSLHIGNKSCYNIGTHKYDSRLNMIVTQDVISVLERICNVEIDPDTCERVLICNKLKIAYSLIF